MGCASKPAKPEKWMQPSDVKSLSLEEPHDLNCKIALAMTNLSRRVLVR
jgi:hypothetical protein